MSNSEKSRNPEQLGTLTVTAPPGVEIEVSDAQFRSLVYSTSSLEMELPVGLYNVAWKAGGRGEERIVRVQPGGNPPVEGGGFALGSAPPSASQGVSGMEKAQFSVATMAVSSRAATKECEIVIIVRSSDNRPKTDLARSIRLGDRSGDAVQAATTGDEPFSGNEHQISVRRYPVSPGSYFLRFEAYDRQHLEQTVHAFEGRRTVVFLKYGSALIPEGRDETARLRIRRGIDPRETTIISTSSDSIQPEELDETSRLADILLHKLSHAEVLYDPDLMEKLKQPDTDPYLKLYGAVLLLRPERANAVALPENRQWTSLAASLIEPIAASGCPDVQCLIWQMAEHDKAPPQGLSALNVPPMLDICWRWASALSVRRPDIIGDNPALAAAAGTFSSSGPWLVWRSADRTMRVNKREKDVELHSGPEMENLLHDMQKILRTISRQTTESGISVGATLLSSATIGIANVAASLLPDRAQTPPADMASRIAFELGTPSSQLRQQIGDALDELQNSVQTTG